MQKSILQAETTLSDGSVVNLNDLNESQLKKINASGEGIYDIIAKSIQENYGELEGYSIYSDSGRAIIEQMIKDNEYLYYIL